MVLESNHLKEKEKDEGKFQVVANVGFLIWRTVPQECKMIR